MRHSHCLGVGVRNRGHWIWHCGWLMTLSVFRKSWRLRHTMRFSPWHMTMVMGVLCKLLKMMVWLTASCSRETSWETSGDVGWVQSIVKVSQADAAARLQGFMSRYLHLSWGNCVLSLCPLFDWVQTNVWTLLYYFWGTVASFEGLWETLNYINHQGEFKFAGYRIGLLQ
jgi:hypothetical protein